MGYILTGYKRAFTLDVTKTINGISQTGYPKTYPTLADIALGYFTYNGTNYPVPPDGVSLETFARWTDVEYQAWLNALKLYVMSLEPGLDFNTDVMNAAVVQDYITCPPGTPVGEEPSSTTTTPSSTTTTPEPPSLITEFTVKYNAVLNDICLGQEVVVNAIQNALWQNGTTVYLGPGLTNPVPTGYIVLVADGEVRNIENGVIGTPTGDNCGTT